MIKYNQSIFVLQILAYLSIIPMIMYGVWWQYLVAIFVYFLNGCLGMIIGYHRLHTHRSFSCPLWFEKFITYCATIGLTGPAIDWVAIHRAHHKYHDTEKDPHSPDHLGRLKVHFLTMFAKVNPKYAIDLIRNKFYIFQRKWYFVINFAYAGALFLIDPFAVIYAWLFPAALVIGFGTLILSASHRNGSPHNDFVLGILTWGDAFHKTHHDDPNLVRLHKYDIAGWIIETFFPAKSIGNGNENGNKHSIIK